MPDQPSACDVANDVRLTAQVAPGVQIIVEGSTDELLWGKFVDSRQRLAVACNKEDALGALAILEAADFRWAVAIVDADFMRIEGGALPSRNAFATDTHDAEMMMLRSAALERVLAEHHACAQSPQRLPVQRRERLLAIAEPLGALRLVSLRCGLALKFEDLDPGKIRRALRALVQYVLQHSGVSLTILEQVAVATDEVLSAGHDPWELCCGHDVTLLLGHDLKGSLKGSDEDRARAVERELRLAYDLAMFSVTGLCAALRWWEAEHPGYPLLRAADSSVGSG